MSVVSVRAFSTQIQRPPEQIKEGIDKVQRFRKHIFNSRKSNFLLLSFSFCYAFDTSSFARCGKSIRA